MLSCSFVVKGAIAHERLTENKRKAIYSFLIFVSVTRYKPENIYYYYYIFFP